MPNISHDLRERLTNAARTAARQAYVKYSGFRVGAAVLTSSGKILTGANVENASYSLSLCAERVALARARVECEHDDEIVAIAIACIDVPSNGPLNLRVPCGACRQWIDELAPNCEIFLDGTGLSFRISDFLPNAFKFGD
jgi:cytidine deaminase